MEHKKTRIQNKKIRKAAMLLALLLAVMNLLSAFTLPDGSVFRDSTEDAGGPEGRPLTGLEEYFLQHADRNYTGTGDFVLRDVLEYKNTFVREEAWKDRNGDGSTDLLDIYEDEDYIQNSVTVNGYAFFYELSEESAYYAAYLPSDLTPGSTFRDFSLAVNNNAGIDLLPEMYHYDREHAILYVRKSWFDQLLPRGIQFSLRSQTVLSVPETGADSLFREIPVRCEINPDQTGVFPENLNKELFTGTVRIPFLGDPCISFPLFSDGRKTGIEASDLKVYMNGAVYENWGYDSSTGILTTSFYPNSVSDIIVVVTLRNGKRDVPKELLSQDAPMGIYGGESEHGIEGICAVVTKDIFSQPVEIHDLSLLPKAGSSIRFGASEFTGSDSGSDQASVVMIYPDGADSNGGPILLCVPALSGMADGNGTALMSFLADRGAWSYNDNGKYYWGGSAKYRYRLTGAVYSDGKLLGNLPEGAECALTCAHVSYADALSQGLNAGALSNPGSPLNNPVIANVLKVTGPDKNGYGYIYLALGSNATTADFGNGYCQAQFGVGRFRYRYIVPTINVKVKKQDQYQKALKGAVFELTIGGSVFRASSGADGYAVFENVPCGETGTLKEISAPEGYEIPEKLKKGISVTTPEKAPASGEIELDPVTNEKLGRLRIRKKDSDSGKAVSGAVFTLYTDAELQHAAEVLPPTDEKGESISGYLKEGVYYLKETKAPEGYVLTDTVSEVRIRADGENGITVMDFANKRQKVKLVLQKSSGTGGPWEFAKRDLSGENPSLKGAVYELYADSTLIRIEDGSTIKKGTLLFRGETDEQGILETERMNIGALDGALLPNGKYYWKEVKAPEGYLLNENPVYVDASYREEDAALELLVPDPGNHFEEIRKGNIRILKSAYSSGKGERPLPGAGFRLYRLEDILTVNGLSGAEDLPYEETGDSAKVLRYHDTKALLGDLSPSTDSEGNTEFYTDENGTAETGDYSYGTYLLFEFDIPEGFDPAAPVLLSVPDEDGTVEIQLTDREKEAGLLIAKIDADTGELIAGNPAYFEIYDRNGEQVLPGNGNVLTTGDSGILNTKEYATYLGYSGSPYTIRETKAPVSYRPEGDLVLTLSEEGIHAERNGAEVPLQISSGEDGIPLLEISLTNRMVTHGTVRKTDLVSGKDVPGAELVILTENGEEFLRWTTDGNPKTIERIPAGNYVLREIRTPYGYTVSEEVPFSVLDTEEIQAFAEMKDDEIYGMLKIVKKEAGSEKKLSGAEFELQYMEDIKDADGEIVHRAGECIEKLITDENGCAELSAPVPAGIYGAEGYVSAIRYLLKETKTPGEDYLPAEDTEIVFTYLDENTGIIEIELTVYDEKKPEETTVTEPESSEETKETTTVPEEPSKREPSKTVILGSEGGSGKILLLLFSFLMLPAAAILVLSVRKKES